LIGGIIGLLPYIFAIFVTQSVAVQSLGINIGLFVPLLSIPLSIIVLVGMLVFVKPQVVTSVDKQEL